jgi:glycosyltransferase involved in cell wall biosynthesis
VAHWDRIKVVHCGIEPGLFGDPAPLPEGGPHLVAVGRFVEQKGHLSLIEALGRLRQSLPGLRLVLVGDGPLRPAIAAAIAAQGLDVNVTLTGWLDEAGVRGAIAGAQALVMPSFAEGLPMVVMEAMAAGRPVLATAIAGIPELVLPGETGWLVPAGDEEALARAVAELAATPVERLAAMGLAGRARVLVRHDADSEAATLATHFRAVSGP